MGISPGGLAPARGPFPILALHFLMADVTDWLTHFFIGGLKRLLVADSVIGRGLTFAWGYF
jgi:hypothetical protein